MFYKSINGACTFSISVHGVSTKSGYHMKRMYLTEKETVVTVGNLEISRL